MGNIEFCQEEEGHKIMGLETSIVGLGLGLVQNNVWPVLKRRANVGRT